MMECLRWTGDECEECPLPPGSNCSECPYYIMEQTECATCAKYGDGCSGEKK